MRTGPAAAAIAAVLLALAPDPAAAASAAEVRALAARAVHDPAALNRLRTIERVDGRRVDVAAALSGARGQDLRARLRALSADPSLPPASTQGAGARARAILAGRRFRGGGLPQLARGLFRRLGEGFAELVEGLARRAPGGPRGVWIAVAVAVLLAGAILAKGLVRRRLAREAWAPEALGPPTARDDPAVLEREAVEAERRGATSQAVRLRFRAGLLRLDRAGAVGMRPSLTSGEVARTLRLDDFDRLAATFDEVAYGGREPERAEVEAFRLGWARVLSEVGAR